MLGRTGYPSVHEDFFTIEDARTYMKKNEVTEPKKVISEAELTFLAHFLFRAATSDQLKYTTDMKDCKRAS